MGEELPHAARVARAIFTEYRGVYDDAFFRMLASAVQAADRLVVFTGSDGIERARGTGVVVEGGGV